MESLDLLTDGCLNLLHKNKLLKPLISSEIKKSLLSTVEINKELKEQLIIDFNKKIGVSNEVELESWLKSNEINEMEFENLALADTRLKQYCEANFKHNVETHFLERKNQLDIVSYSLLRLKDFYTARELYLRILEKEADFGDLAISFSEGIEKTTRGMIGPLPLEKAHTGLVDKLRNSKPGEVQPPIHIEGSYLLIRLESLETAQLDGFMRGKMLLELFNKSIDEKTNEYHTNLLNRTKKNNNNSEEQ